MAYGSANTPAPVREQVEGALNMLLETLGSRLVGVYLHGSLAMGSFQSGRSDIDLMAVCEEDIDPDDKKVLTKQLLRRSNQPYPVEFHLLTRAQLQPWRHPCPFAYHYSEGWRSRYEAAALANSGLESLEALTALPAFAGAVDPDLAAHVRVVRSHGGTLWGEPLTAVFPAVPDADFLAAVRADVDVPFRDVSKQPVYYVLNLLRVLRFQTDGSVVSKEEAGRWGMEALPFHIETIADALALYQRPPEPREALHFDVEPLQAFLRSCRRRLGLEPS
jgi:predicted nucleotidyltransferase